MGAQKAHVRNSDAEVENLTYQCRRDTKLLSRDVKQEIQYIDSACIID